MTKKIAVIGISGRTGTLFAYELRNVASILGIGRKSAVDKIKAGKVFILEEGKPIQIDCVAFSESYFSADTKVDYIFLATKNPVAPVIKYYYERADRENPPDLILSQNGFLAADEAHSELEKMFGANAQKIRIIRVSLFNPVSIEQNGEISLISYFLPIRLAFGIASGPDEFDDIREIFKTANIEAYEVAPENVKNMEFSKLFTNLIGVASSARGLTIEEGFASANVFTEEIMALREFINVVKKSGGHFLNFNHYPIKLFAFLISVVPIYFLRIFRKQTGKLIIKGRGGKGKGNIDEIDYYNGAVIKLGEGLGIDTPVNKKIYQAIKEKL